MPACHLVADRDLPLLGQVYLHQLHDAGRQLVRLEDLVDPFLGALPNPFDAHFRLLDRAANPVVGLAVLDLERRQIHSPEVQLQQVSGRELLALREERLDGASLEEEGGGLTLKGLPELLIPGLAHPSDLRSLDLPQAGDPLAMLALQERVVDPSREYLHVDHRAFDARRDAQRAVLHVLGLLTEDGREQFLLRRQLRLSLRRDLADQDVAGLHGGTNPHDAAIVQVDQRLFGHVRDLARDLLHPALGVPHVELELLEVDRGQRVVLRQPLADDDGVLEIVPVPRHEGDEKVLAKGQ